MDEKGPEKKQRLLGALEQGMVMIHLDARRPGVLVPPALRGESHLRLNLSYRFDPPDLSVGEWGVRSTLSFSGQRFTVAVPWSALFALTSHVTKEVWAYPDDMPPELVPAGLDKPAPSTAEAPPAAAKPAGPLREVSPEASAGPAKATPEEPTEEPKPRSRSHLRVVK